MPSPLQSGTARSNSGFNHRAAQDCEQMVRHAAEEGSVQVTPCGSAMLVAACYPPFESEIDNGPFLRIALSTGPATRLMHQVDGVRLEGIWRPGTLAIGLPDGRGQARAGRTETIGLALLARPEDSATDIDLDHVATLACNFQDDPMLVSVITALHHEAALHGASTAFFDAGRARVLQRLNELRGRPSRPRTAHPLSDQRYARVTAFVQEHLADDLSVARLARIAGLDSSGFSRALRARTGLAPYAWLTQQRMERACTLLRSGVSVTRVAAMSGYANPSKFASAFRRMIGSPPSRWRRLDSD